MKTYHQFNEGVTYIGVNLDDDENVSVIKDLFTDVGDYVGSLDNSNFDHVRVFKIKNSDPDLEKYPFVYQVNIHYWPFGENRDIFQNIKKLANIERLESYGFKIVKQNTESLNVLSLFIALI